MEDLKEIIELDFESIITNDKAEEYREEYEMSTGILKCWKDITLKEFTYCKENAIDECKFIKAKYGADSYCKDCDEQSFWGGPMFGMDITPVIIMIILTVIIIILFRVFLLDNIEIIIKMFIDTIKNPPILKI